MGDKNYELGPGSLYIVGVDLDRSYEHLGEVSEAKCTYEDYIEEIICNPGCLCCVCEFENKDFKKKFNDTVICYQRDGKCIYIEVLE